VCAEMARREEVRSPQDVDRLVGELYFAAGAREKNANLADVSNRMLSSYLDAEQREEHRAAALDLYGKVLRGRTVADDETSRLVGVLKLSGVTRSVGGRLAVRNRIYRQVFDRRWVQESMPDAERRRQRAAYRRGALRTAFVSVAILAVIGALALAAVNNARRANANAQQARRAEVAEARQKQEFRKLLYVADMGRARQAWEEGNVTQATELLEFHKHDRDLLGWEWGYLWRTCNKPESLRVFRDLGGPANVVAFSRDDRMLAASISGMRPGEPGRVLLWDVETWKHLPPITGLPTLVFALAFSPDGRILAVGVAHGALPGERGEVLLWNVIAKRIVARLETHGSLPAKICFSRDGRTLALRGFEAKAHVWDVPARRVLRTFDIRSTGVLYVLALSPDGRTVAIERDAQTVVLHDVANGRETAVARERNGIIDFDLSPDGRILAVGLWNGDIALRDGASLRLLSVLTGHRAAVQNVAFSRDSRLLASSSEDATIRLWEVATGQAVAVLRGHEGSVWGGVFSPDGRLFASSSAADGTVRLWRVGKPDAHPNPDQLPVYGSLAFGPDSRVLAVRTDSAPVPGRRAVDVTLWDVASGWAPTMLSGHKAYVRSVAFSLDGRLLTTGGEDRTVRLWRSLSRAEMNKETR
jgi:WD40 repeat protein